jgi:hypothetical protein
MARAKVIVLGYNSDAEHAPAEAVGKAGVGLDDFFAYMVMHNYIFAPSRDLWPAPSVNARIPPVMEDGQKVSATAWLDRHRPVEQITWLPGAPMLLENRLIAQGGFIDRNGVSAFNLYRPPIIKPGDAKQAGPLVRPCKQGIQRRRRSHREMARPSRAAIG